MGKKRSLSSGNPESDAEFSARLERAKARAAKPEPEQKAERQELGRIINLPAKRAEDPVLRLEQNLGCELPVCVSNRRDVRRTSIEVSAGGATTWRLTRSAETLLPAPEHYRYWLWFLDRCREAAEAGEEKPPRIVLNPPELYDLFGIEGAGKKGGSWYREIDDAFKRFSHLILGVHEAFHTPKGGVTVCGGALGTLCTYVSWRTKQPSERQELFNFEKGWVAPGPMLWATICNGYLKAVPLQPMRYLTSYVAQRLLAYLTKHCRPGEQYKVSLAKLLPKIPMSCAYNETKRRLGPHHRALLNVGFLASEPVFESRGTSLTVTYERSDEGF